MQADSTCHALADSYALGAESGGHLVRRITLAELDIPPLRSQHDWEEGELPASLKPAQDDIGWAEHIVFFFPLWLGDMPALVKGFLEQVARPGFAIIREKSGKPWGKKRPDGAFGPRCGDHGYASACIPLVLSRPQHQVA